MNQKIGPDKVLRGIAFFSLLAMGAAAIYRAKHPGYLTDHGSQLSDTVYYLFCSFILFGIFYGEYVWIRRLLKRELSDAFGFVQAFLGLGLLLLGLFSIWNRDMGASARFSADNMAITLAILGEALFVANVCWTLLQPESAARPPARAPLKRLELTPAPLQAQVTSALPPHAKSGFNWIRWLKPENPLEKFAVTAIFLFGGGALLWLAMPESRFLILWGGQKYFLPMGLLWWICAVPFGAFALAYWLHAGRHTAQYDKWLTKVHLGLTFLWLLDFIRIVTRAQWSMLSRLPDLLNDSYTFELYVILGASIVMFFVNIRRAPSTAVK